MTKLSKQEMFIESCIAGDIISVQLLLNDSQVDPTAGNNSAIRWASLIGYYEVVKILLQDGRVNPSDCDHSALHWAKQKQHWDIIRLLKKYYQEHGLAIPKHIL